VNYKVDTNLHLFRDVTKQVLTVSLNQHRKIMPPLDFGQHCTTFGHYFSMLTSAAVSVCIHWN